MANLPTFEDPKWPEVYELAVNDPVAGGPDGVDNTPHKQLAERTEYLKQQTDQARADLDDHETRLAAVEGSSAVAVSKAQRLAWENSDEGFAFELFSDPVHNWRDMQPVSVTRTVAGDDSIDVESTAGLVVGASYVIFGNGTAETVVVAEKLTATRLKATANLTVTRDSGSLARTDWTIHSGYAEASGNSRFYSKPLPTLRYWDDGILVVRRNSGDGELHISVRQVGSSQWHQAEFLESKTVDTRTRDQWYRLPVGGTVEIRVHVLLGPSGENLRIGHLMLLTSPQAGRADPVRQPVITSPVSGATGVMETPTVTVDAYRSLYGLDQGGLRVRVYLDEQMQSLVYSGTSTGATTSHQIAAGNLQTDRVYWVVADLWDNEDTYSPASDPVPFTTGSVFQYVQQPSVISPAPGAEVSQTNVTIVLDQMQVEAGGTGNQTAGRFLVASDLAGTNIVYDSGEVADLTSHVVAGDPLTRGETYYAFGMQKDETRGWSERSAGVRFFIQQIGNGVRVDGGVAVGPTTFADGQRGFLVVATAACRVKRKWGLYYKDTSLQNVGTTYQDSDPQTGEYNTEVLTSSAYNTFDDGNGSIGAPAAEYCKGLLHEGCSDFFLMSKEEMSLAYSNRVVIDAADETVGTKLSAMGDDLAWTSTERDGKYAHFRRFSDGFVGAGIEKVGELLVVPARRILI